MLSPPTGSGSGSATQRRASHLAQSSHLLDERQIVVNSFPPDVPGVAGLNPSRIIRRGLSRRMFIGSASAATAVALGAAPAAAASASPSPAVRQGLATEAPHLPPGFADTFSSRYIDVNGLRLHAVVGGVGEPLLLVHGWPESWYAWRLVMPTLARKYRVIAIDQPGMGLSDKPVDGYDTASLARDLVGAMDTLGHSRFSVFGHDTGMVIAYGLAADYPDRVERLAVAEAPLPGVGVAPTLFEPEPVNDRVWHIAFNRLAAVNEQLVQGREDIYFGYEFSVQAEQKLPDYAVDHYIRMLSSSPQSLSGSFGFYRALDVTIAQNQQRATRKLTMPVLAIGGEASVGAGVGATMQLVADNVQTAVISGAGHFVAEEAPQEVLAALMPFLAG